MITHTFFDVHILLRQLFRTYADQSLKIFQNNWLQPNMVLKSPGNVVIYVNRNCGFSHKGNKTINRFFT